MAYECQNICLKQLGSRVMPRNMSKKAHIILINHGELSSLDTQRSAREYPKIVNNIQPCPNRCLLMLLACIGARTDSTVHTAGLNGSVTVLFHARVTVWEHDLYYVHMSSLCTFMLHSLCSYQGFSFSLFF